MAFNDRNFRGNSNFSAPREMHNAICLIAMLRLRYLSSPIQKDRFTAESVFLTTGHPEKTADTKCNFVITFTSTLITFPFSYNPY
jgi:hypothetical protein